MRDKLKFRAILPCQNRPQPLVNEKSNAQHENCGQHIADDSAQRETLRNEAREENQIANREHEFKRDKRRVNMCAQTRVGQIFYRVHLGLHRFEHSVSNTIPNHVHSVGLRLFSSQTVQ